jgi:hypothetical protein
MAQRIGLSQTAIVRIWRAFGLQPHRVENFKFSKDPQVVEKVQARNRTQLILPLVPGVATRQSNDYERHGVTSLFPALDVASGVTISNCYRRRPAPGIPQVPQPDRCHLPHGIRCPPRNGQLRHAQGQQGASLVAAKSAL